MNNQVRNILANGFVGMEGTTGESTGISIKRKFPWVLYAQKIRNVNNK